MTPVRAEVILKEGEIKNTAIISESFKIAKCRNCSLEGVI